LGAQYLGSTAAPEDDASGELKKSGEPTRLCLDVGYMKERKGWCVTKGDEYPGTGGGNGR